MARIKPAWHPGSAWAFVGVRMLCGSGCEMCDEGQVLASFKGAPV